MKLLHSEHPLYETWISMRQRCNNPSHKSYPNYGGRGITVCDRWNDFNLFVEDMGERPKGYSIDRINNDGNYEPSNCRWASKSQQASNRHKRNIIIHSNDPMRCIIICRRKFQVRKTVNGKRVYKSFNDLESAKDFRSNLEMECQMMLSLK